VVLWQDDKVRFADEHKSASEALRNLLSNHIFLEDAGGELLTAVVYADCRIFADCCVFVDCRIIADCCMLAD
jgi:hypothetical protein